MADNEGQMSIKKLSMLGALLMVIWVLCYQAELQLEPRRLLETYEKFLPRNVSEAAEEMSRNLIIGAKEVDYKLMQKQTMMYLFPKVLNHSVEKSICVILTHETQEQNNFNMIKSILEQDYTNFKVLYFRKASESQEVYRFIEENALDNNKVRMVENANEGGFLGDFLEGKTYCEKEDIIMYLSDQDQILGIHGFNLINNMFDNQNNPSTFLYTAGLNSDLKLARSYPYPQEVMDNKTFEKYPFVPGGIIAFSSDLYQSIQKDDFLNSEGLMFKKARNIAYGLKMVKKAGKNVIYVHIPLLVDKNEQEPLTLDEELKKEYKEIKMKQGNI